MKSLSIGKVQSDSSARRSTQKKSVRANSRIDSVEYSVMGVMNQKEQSKIFFDDEVSLIKSNKLESGQLDNNSKYVDSHLMESQGHRFSTSSNPNELGTPKSKKKGSTKTKLAVNSSGSKSRKSKKSEKELRRINSDQMSINISDISEAEHKRDAADLANVHARLRELAMGRTSVETQLAMMPKRKESTTLDEYTFIQRYFDQIAGQHLDPKSEDDQDSAC